MCFCNIITRYCQRSAAAHKVFGDCISINAIDQLRMTRKATKAVR